MNGLLKKIKKIWFYLKDQFTWWFLRESSDIESLDPEKTINPLTIKERIYWCIPALLYWCLQFIVFSLIGGIIFILLGIASIIFDKPKNDFFDTEFGIQLILLPFFAPFVWLWRYVRFGEYGILNFY